MKLNIIFSSVVCSFFIIGFSTPMTFAESVTQPVVTVSEPVHDAGAVENQVREFFADTPMMVEIARCESNFRQFTDAGNVLRGAGGTIGIFQFKESIHSTAAFALGHDLETIDGNLAYARHLYNQSGTQPWISCVPAVVPVPTPATDDVTELKIQLMTQLVVLLQELLRMKLAMQ